MANNKVLITGSEGFIGSHLVEEMLKKGFSVKAFIHYNYMNSIGWLENIDKLLLENVEFIFGDIRDLECVEKALINCSSIINLAALIGIPYSYNATSSYVDTNINGALNCLLAAKKMKLDKIIMTSTSEVYGSGEYFPMDEKHPLKAQSPYAATKIGSDQLALSFYRSFELPVSVIRPFNTYGPRQSARAIIPTIISQLNNKSTTIKLGNIKAKRDFTYVSDTANGFIKALEKNESIGKVINLGTNYNFDIESIVNLISKLTNIKIKIESEEERKRPKLSEVDNLLCDNNLAKDLLNWEPLYSGKEGFEAGLKKTIKWFNQSENIKFYHSDKFVI